MKSMISGEKSRKVREKGKFHRVVCRKVGGSNFKQTQQRTVQA